MSAPATVDIFYRARCRCGWQGHERTNSADAHADRRLHNLAHLTSDLAKAAQ